jgi:hypothetical protein
LFDRKRYGINYAFLIAFVSASIINTSCNQFLSFGFGNMSVYLPLILTNVVVSCIYGLLLLFLSHLVKRNWLLPFFWALIVFIPQGLFFSGMETGAYAAAGGFLFMAGLILAIQLWGVRIWSLMIGLIGTSLLASGSFYLFYGLQLFDTAGTSLSVIRILVPSVLQALILYAGFYLHLQRANAHRKSIDSQYSRA